MKKTLTFLYNSSALLLIAAAPVNAAPWRVWSVVLRFNFLSQGLCCVEESNASGLTWPITGIVWVHPAAGMTEYN